MYERILILPDLQGLEDMWENGHTGNPEGSTKKLYGADKLWYGIQKHCSTYEEAYKYALANNPDEVNKRAFDDKLRRMFPVAYESKPLDSFLLAYQKVPEPVIDAMNSGFAILVTGPPGMGKTYLMLALFPKYFFCDNTEMFKLFNPTKHEGIIIDEASPYKLSWESFIALAEPNKPGTQRILFGTVHIPQCTPRILISNYTLDDFLQVYSKEVLGGRALSEVSESEKSVVVAAGWRVVVWEINEFVGKSKENYKGTKDIRIVKTGVGKWESVDMGDLTEKVNEFFEKAEKSTTQPQKKRKGFSQPGSSQRSNR